MRFVNTLPFVATLALLTCCAPAPTPIPPSPPTPAPPAPPPAPPTLDWRDAPLTPGGWSYRADGQRSIAAFGSGTAAAVFTLACDRPGRTISLDRALAAIPTAAGTISLRTTFGDGQWSAGGADPARPILTAKLSATDPLLDQLAYSRGRFMVEASGTKALILPVWPEIARVIEDCRS